MTRQNAVFVKDGVNLDTRLTIEQGNVLLDTGTNSLYIVALLRSDRSDLIYNLISLIDGNRYTKESSLKELEEYINRHGEFVKIDVESIQINQKKVLPHR